MNLYKRYMNIDEFYRNIILTILITLLSLFIGLFIIYLLISLIPGDPVAAYLAAMGIHNPSNQLYQQIARQLGIDNFFEFIIAFFTGNWRISTSFRLGYPVIDLIGEAMPITIGFVTIPLLIGLGLGIFLGKLSSRNKGTSKAKTIQLFSIFGISIPIFFLGMTLKYFLCYELGICEPTGLSMVPIAVLTFSITAIVTFEIHTYRIKKLNNRSLISNSILIGSIFGFVFMFYIIIEQVFAIAGIGDLLIESLWVYDYFLLRGCLYTILIIFVILILISNLLFSYSKHQVSQTSEDNLKSNSPISTNKVSNDELTSKENIKIFSLKRLKSPMFIFGAVLGIFFIFISLFPQIIAKQSFNEAKLPHAGAWEPPSPEHPLGQTVMGGDVLSRTIWGLRDALFFCFLAVMISLIIGGFFGYIADIFKYWGDRIIMGLMIFFYIFPGLILSLLLLAILGPFASTGLPIIVILLIPNFTRAIADDIPGKINVKRIVKTVIDQIPFNLAIAILLYISIGFLGFFVDTGIRLGTDIRLGAQYLSGAPWASLWPGFATFGLIFSFLTLHLGLKGIEPKLREMENIELE